MRKHTPPHKQIIIMTEEEIKKNYIFDMLDELSGIIQKTEEPLYNLKLIDNAYFYGYNHKRINEPLPSVPLSESQIVKVLYADIMSMTRRLRELHPLVSPVVICALTSFCLQVGFDTYMQSRLKELVSSDTNILDIAASLGEWTMKDGKENENFRRRRMWEIGLMCNQEKDLDIYISIWGCL